MGSYQKLRKKLLKNKAIKDEYEKLRVEYEFLDKLIALRLKNKLTQKELAEKIATKQSAISRFEKGLINPTVAFLSKLAQVFNKKLVIDFK